MKDKNKRGKPPKFDDINVFNTKIKEYFKLCDENKEPYTMTGLTKHLDIDYQTLLNYKEKDDYFESIKKAKSYCEEYLVNNMIKGDINPSVGIFLLKSNYNYVENPKENEVKIKQIEKNIELTQKEIELKEQLLTKDDKKSGIDNITPILEMLERVRNG